MLFGPFRFFYIVGKLAYKIELSTKWKIHNIFDMSLFEQDITKKEQVDKTLSKSEKDLKFETKGNKEYEVKAIIDSVMYSQ